MLIDHNRPPMVVINTDGRKVTENWLALASGASAHILIIVGYGEDVDPFDLRKKPYFIVRDSLVKSHRHYRVSAAKLLGAMTELHKITAIREL